MRGKVLELDKGFLDVFEAFKEGKYVVRNTWKPGTYLHRKYSTAIIEAHDLLANNWVILE
jgi:hypothetical protein